jgi:hypothetical protein
MRDKNGRYACRTNKPGKKSRMKMPAENADVNMAGEGGTKNRRAVANKR